MAFVLDVGTDLFGVKHNTRIEFPSLPTLSELILAVERQFDRDVRERRPAGVPYVPFRVQTMQVYDDVLLRWVDLHSPTQLRNGAQVFVFQPESIHHSEIPGALPPAATATAATEAWLGSPARAQAAAEAGVNATLSEKLRRVFFELDVAHRRAVPIATLRDYFAKYEVPWTAASVGDYYHRAGDITYDEWVRFATSYPTLIDSLYYRRFGLFEDRPLYSVPPHSPPTRAESDSLAAKRAREEELRRSYSLGWTAEKETIDRQYRAARSAELDLQIRHLTTKNQLDRIRANERADCDAAALSAAMSANAASPPRRRDDLVRMYYSPASPRFGYLSP